ncbi:hypothetical protein ALC57_15783, partial [Trachymyrmex cornetzi]
NDLIKCIENNIYKLPIDERISISNHSLPVLNNLASCSLHCTEVDRSLLQLAKNTRVFLRDMNDRVIFTRADKENVTVALDRQMYISKVNEMLQDVNTYEVVVRVPTRRMVTGLRALLVRWKEKKYISDSTYRGLLCNDGMLPMAYVLPKISLIFENINNRLKNIIMASNRKRVVSDNSVDVVQPSWFTVPFIRGITEKFNRLNSEHMRVSLYSVNKLREFIRVHKDPLSRDKKSKVVYKISCKSCDASYVGQTCRQLQSRITEHKNHIRWNTSARSVITEHRLQEGHDFDWDNVAILDEEPHYRKRLISEMIFIRRQTHGLNLQTDMEGLPKAYLPII